MPDFAIQSADPFGLGVIDDDGIIVTNISGGPRKDFVEVLAGNARYIEAAVVQLRPREEWTVAYELRTGTLVVPFGVALNGVFLVTAFSCGSSNDGYPTASITAIKPSSPTKIKPYSFGAITLSAVGGFGIVNKFGMTAAASFISSNLTISMQTAEALHETSGDYETGGLYHYGFKKEVSAEAYGAIVCPGTWHITEDDDREGRDAWNTFAVSAWEYMDAI